MRLTFDGRVFFVDDVSALPVRDALAVLEAYSGERDFVFSADASSERVFVEWEVQKS